MECTITFAVLAIQCALAFRVYFVIHLASAHILNVVITYSKNGMSQEVIFASIEISKHACRMLRRTC